MNPSEGLQTALNEIRETLIQDNSLYQEQIPLVNHYNNLGSLYPLQSMVYFGK